MEERPLGGTETGIIRLAETLDHLGHDVIVLTPARDIPLTKPLYVPVRAWGSLGEFDVVIFIRDWKQLFTPCKTKKKFFWTGDAFTCPHTIGIGDRRFILTTDGMLCVSDWQAKTLCAASGFPEQKTFILRNGVNLADFHLSPAEKPQRRRLIYTSMVNRGLAHLPYIYAPLKNKYPDLELHVFSSIDKPRTPEDPDDEELDSGTYSAKVNLHNALMTSLKTMCKMLPDCYLHGRVLQSELAKELMKSTVFTYPCHFEESSCIAVLEAQAAGCPVVTTNIAALREAVGEGGILIQGKPDTKEYRMQFVAAVDRLLSDEAYYQELSKHALRQAKEYDWQLRAQSLLAYFASEHGLR